jgi:meso-butanediol dehydrogenase/(S,S)-butanediol dehydrogenase/diacetyl reductase
MKSKGLKARMLGFSRAALLSGLAAAMLAGAPGIAAAKDSVTVSVVLALAAGEWSTEILAGANAAAKDLGGKVNVRVTGPTTFDPQRQAQMFLAELETKPDVLVVVNVAPPLFTQPALEAQSRGANIVWINVPPMPEVKNALFVASDAFGMGQTGGEIVVAALEKSLGKPAAEIGGDVVTAVCVPGAVALQVNVTDRASVKAMIQATVRAFGRLDVMFNNAGISKAGQFLEATEEDWARIMGINGLGVLIGMQEAAKQMIAQGGGGKIINTASIAGKVGEQIATIYCASKACVISLTQAGAEALGKYNITVNSFSPGFVKTPLWDGLDKDLISAGYRDEPNAVDHLAKTKAILGRVSTPRRSGRRHNVSRLVPIRLHHRTEPHGRWRRAVDIIRGIP